MPPLNSVVDFWHRRVNQHSCTTRRRSRQNKLLICATRAVTENFSMWREKDYFLVGKEKDTNLPAFKHPRVSVKAACLGLYQLLFYTVRMYVPSVVFTRSHHKNMEREKCSTFFLVFTELWSLGVSWLIPPHFFSSLAGGERENVASFRRTRLRAEQFSFSGIIIQTKP